MIVGTAGHIDHGKTALVKALTGVDADRLKEEKARGITIDLGYAYHSIGSGQMIGFVDVPGHERFIHNMLAGATGINYVLLVIAADDGPMPQTHEHLAILDLLGLSHGSVVLSKIDLVDAKRQEEVTRQIRELLDGTTLEQAPIMPVSTLTGEGVAALGEHLRRVAATASPQRRSGGNFRMAVDRSFTIAGIGTVVTGTVFSGEVRPEDRLTVSPAGIEVRVRGLHAQNREAASGSMGQRCALNLVAPQLEKKDIARGQWVLGSAVHAPTARLDARLSLLPGELKGLRHWTPVHVHLGTSDVTGRVALLSDEILQPGGQALVRLVLDQPVGALHGDRFIIRDQSAQRTIGGGGIIDPFPPERGGRKPHRHAVLRALEIDDHAESLKALLHVSVAGVDLSRFAMLRNLSQDERTLHWQNVSMQLVKTMSGDFGFAADHWRSCRDSVLDMLATWHGQRPESAGMTVDELRSGMSQASRLEKPILAVLLGELFTERLIVRAGGRFQLPGHEVQLSPTEQVLWERAQPALREAGIESLRVAALAQLLMAPEEALRQVMGRLVRMGKLLAVRRDHYFLPDVVAGLAAQAQQIAEADVKKVLTVGPFREGTGISRNLGIPMLEFFDRSGFTIRFNHGRRIRRQCAEVFGEAAEAVSC
jgi:selenocysteine-specific elongation factor